MDVYCGIDWAEDHHDIALVDGAGNLLARRRLSDEILDAIDRIVAPGVTLNPADDGWVSPALEPAARRR